jgi:hypothetical protein
MVQLAIRNLDSYLARGELLTSVLKPNPK